MLMSRLSFVRHALPVIIAMFAVLGLSVLMGCQPARVEVPPPIKERLGIPPDIPADPAGKATVTREEFTALVRQYESELQRDSQSLITKANEAREEAAAEAARRAAETKRNVNRSKRTHERTLAALVDQQIAEIEAIEDADQDAQAAVERAAQVQLARYESQVQSIRASSERVKAQVAAAIAEADRKDAQQIAIANLLGDVAGAASGAGVSGPLALVGVLASLGVGWFGLRRPGDVPKPVADAAVATQERYREAARGLAAAVAFLPRDLKERLSAAGIPDDKIREILSRVSKQVDQQLTPEDKAVVDQLARNDGIAIES